MPEEVVYYNIETIIKILLKTTIIRKMTKYDGITIECIIPRGKTFEECKQSVTSACKELPIPNNQKQISIELSDDRKRFALQFPDLVPLYSQEQIDEMNKTYLSLLINEALKRAEYGPVEVKVTKQAIINGVDVYTTEAIRMHYKSNCNQYKNTLESVIEDVKYRNNVRDVFFKVVDEITQEKHIK